MQAPGHSTWAFLHQLVPLCSILPSVFSPLVKCIGGSGKHHSSVICCSSSHFCGFKKPWTAVSLFLRMRHWQQLKSTMIFNRFWTKIWKDKVVMELNYDKFQLLSSCFQLSSSLGVDKCFQSHGALRILRQLINSPDRSEIAMEWRAGTVYSLFLPVGHVECLERGSGESRLWCSWHSCSLKYC